MVDEEAKNRAMLASSVSGLGHLKKDFVLGVVFMAVNRH